MSLSFLLETKLTSLKRGNSWQKMLNVIFDSVYSNLRTCLDVHNT